MNVTYIAHSGFILDEKGTNIGIDLWLNSPVNPKNYEDIPKLHYVFCTHDHDDHGLEDMIELAKRDDATFVAVNEVARYAQEKGVQKVVGANIGGEFQLNTLKVYITPALHTAQRGVPVGFIVQFPSGKTIYHMGDTGYFDLKYIPELYKIDVLFIPIGSFYTMGPREAIMAVRDIKPQNIIPMHYNTFPTIKTEPQQFLTMVQTIDGAGCQIIEPGHTIAC
jgi:L-ascorbate metabolism protein UlaG (beta-lactamase superfamily)